MTGSPRVGYLAVFALAVALVPSALAFSPQATRAPGARLAPTCVTPPPNLRAWYSAEGNTLDRTGTHDGSGNPSYAPGEVGNGFSFDGATQKVDLPVGSAPSGNAARTFEFWMNPDATFAAQGGHEVFHYGVNTTRQAFGMDVDGVSGGGNLLLEAFTWADDETGIDTGAPVGQWIHVAMTYDGSTTVRVYANGQLRATKALSGVLNTGNSTVELGHFVGWYKGGLDEFTIYDRELSQAEINSIYLAGTSGKCTQVSAVRVSSFTARRDTHGVVVRWRSAGVDSVGFNIWRTGSGVSRKLNSQLVDGIAAGAMGRWFAFRDASAKQGTHYVYRLQAVSSSGTLAWVASVRN